MIQELQEIYDYYLSLGKEERVKAVRDSSNNFLGYLNSKGVDEDLATKLFVAILAIFIDADEDVSDAELSLFNDAFGTKLTREELSVLTRECSSNKELVDNVDKVVDSLPNPIKADVVIIGLSLISADGELTDDEIEIFEKILC